MNRNYASLFKSIAEQWFLSEPLLFGVLCTHELKPNPEMLCLMRTGQLKIEYNHVRLEHIREEDIRQMLRTEVIRIILMHPYQRLPLTPDRTAMVIASDITIAEHGHRAYGMYTRENWAQSDCRAPLPVKGYFEEYYALVRHEMMGLEPDKEPSDEDCPFGQNNELLPWKGELGGEVPPKALNDTPSMSMKIDAGDLWEPDDVTCDRIHRVVDRVLSTHSQGSISDSLIEEYLADRRIRLNARRHLAMFHASVISTKRNLSRMRPSRRYGFTQMGVKHPYRTRLLVGIDTSESVSESSLREFIGIINRFFHSGVEAIDLLCFDSELHLPVVSLRKSRSSLALTGRGGTDFQPIVEYFETHGYDGMIVFTDGAAETPQIKNPQKILWILTDRLSFENSTLQPRIYIPH